MSVQGSTQSSLRLARRSVLLLGVFSLTGCTSIFKKSDAVNSASDTMPWDEEDSVEYVGQLTDAWGLGYTKIESVALLTELNGTGSDPEPSPRRTRLMNEMKAREIDDVNMILNSDNTALVLVQAYLPPGIQKGDRFDVFVQAPSRTKTESLRGGYLLPTRLKPMEVLGNTVRTGAVQGNATGALLVDAVFEEDEPSKLLRGVVLGGGMAAYTRPFGLVCHSDIASVAATTSISGAINRRFSTIDRGERTGVATPKNDELIELLLPPEYRFHMGRFIQVVREIVVDETPQMRAERIDQLARELHEPFLAARAAIRLEAIGSQAVPALMEGLSNRDPEIRFHAAEALAYMGEDPAAPVLGEIARHEEALRWHAMTALASMNSVEAGMALSDLLHVESPETRYAAFRSLHARSPNDPMIRGELLTDDFFYHVIPSNAPPFVHFSRSKRPEIVLFGHDQEFADSFLYVKRGTTIKSNGDGTMTLSSFDAFNGDQRVDCSSRVDEVIREMIRLGADFEDIFDVVRHAHVTGTLNSHMEVNALPDPNLEYDRGEEGAIVDGDTGSGRTFLGARLPDLFFNSASQAKIDEDENPEFEPRTYGEAPRKKSFFGRMTGWLKGA